MEQLLLGHADVLSWLERLGALSSFLDAKEDEAVGAGGAIVLSNEHE